MSTEIWNILFLIGGLVILIIGGELLVSGAQRSAYRFKLSPLVVGLTIVAFGTSAPELCISIYSSLNEKAGIAIGNVVGSNICNLALVLGITALVAPVVVDKKLIKFDWPITLFASLLAFLYVYWDQEITLYEGISFVVLLISYVTYSIYESRKENSINSLSEEEQKLDALENEKEEKVANVGFKDHWIVDVLLIAVGVAGLSYGSKWFVDGASGIATGFDIDERIIGLTVVALGTSLPELVTSVMAAIKKDTDLAIGNLLGSNIFNVFSILGFTSIVKTIPVTIQTVQIDMIWMIGITLSLLPMMLIRGKIAKFEGLILLSIYGYYTYSILIP